MVAMHGFIFRGYEFIGNAEDTFRSITTTILMNKRLNQKISTSRIRRLTNALAVTLTPYRAKPTFQSFPACTDAWLNASAKTKHAVLSLLVAVFADAVEKSQCR
ncbi:MAG: hypothetical protein ACLROR_05320 [Klebsiella michiganensis]